MLIVIRGHYIIENPKEVGPIYAKVILRLTQSGGALHNAYKLKVPLARP